MLVEINSVEEFNNIITKNKIAIVDYYANWCQPCKAIAPKLDKLQETFKDIFFCKINSDNDNVKSLVQNINSLPTFHFFYDGKLIHTIIGAKYNDIVEYCEQLIKKHNLEVKIFNLLTNANK